MISLGFGLLLVVLALLSIIAVMNGRALVRNSAAVIHSHGVLSRVAEISGMARDIQNGYRGFLITGQEEFLEHYMVADANVLSRLAELRERVANDPRQSGRIDALEALIKELLKHAREVIEVRERLGREVALEMIQGGRGKDIMEELRRTMAEVTAVEESSLEKSRAESESVLRGTMTAAILGGIVGALAVGAAIIVLRADIREREKLEKALVAEGDREQRRIGQDLHDGLCQQLVGIGYLAQALENNLQGASDQNARAAHRISELTGAAVTQARNVAYGLHPVELVEDGLMSALGQLAITTEETFGIPCEFECPRQVLVSDNVVAMHLYRIAREAVHNAARHAQPERIVIRLIAREDVVSLEIQDDGRGMPVRMSRKTASGIGLQTMRFRADGLGGDLLVDSKPGMGTSVTCRFPARVAKVEPWTGHGDIETGRPTPMKPAAAPSPGATSA